MPELQLHVTPLDGKPLYRQLIDQITRLVASGTLEAGQGLPPVRKLAEQLAINPNTVARSYRVLQELGVVHTRVGAGVFVAESGLRLTTQEMRRLLSEKIDELLDQAYVMGVPPETLGQWIAEQAKSRRSTGTEG